MTKLDLVAPGSEHDVMDVIRYGSFPCLWAQSLAPYQVPYEVEIAAATIAQIAHSDFGVVMLLFFQKCDEAD